MGWKEIEILFILSSLPDELRFLLRGRVTLHGNALHVDCFHLPDAMHTAYQVHHLFVAESQRSPDLIPVRAVYEYYQSGKQKRLGIPFSWTVDQRDRKV